jgi:hypothetical protein
MPIFSTFRFVLQDSERLAGECSPPNFLNVEAELSEGGGEIELYDSDDEVSVLVSTTTSQFSRQPELTSGRALAELPGQRRAGRPSSRPTSAGIRAAGGVAAREEEPAAPTAAAAAAKAQSDDGRGVRQPGQGGRHAQQCRSSAVLSALEVPPQQFAGHVLTTAREGEFL